MSQYFVIHPENPQKRLLQQAAHIVHDGGVIVYPTDSGYAIGCHLGDKQAIDRILQIRYQDKKQSKQHKFTLMCRDLAEIATFAKVENWQYRLLKSHTPGSYTFVLNATREVPRLMQSKRKTIGVRVPNHQICLEMLAEIGEPMMSSSLIPSSSLRILAEPNAIRELLEHQVDLIIDAEQFCPPEPTTVVDLTGDVPEILRHGQGAVDWIEHA